MTTSRARQALRPRPSGGSEAGGRSARCSSTEVSSARTSSTRHLRKSGRTTPGAPVQEGPPPYEVVRVGFPGERRERSVLYAGPNFLDAADYACEYIDREEPPAIEIQRHGDDGTETVWTYSKERAAAEASTEKTVVETFGFD